MIRLLPEGARGRSSAVAGAVLTLLLAGCADMGASAPQASMQDAQSLGIAAAAPASGVTPAVAATPAIDSQWWRDFGDAQLDSLVDQAVQGNPSLLVAQARLASAMASVSVVDSNGKPHLDGSVDLQRQRFSGNFIYPAPLGGSEYNIGEAKLNFSWELDFFGRNRTALDAAIGTANATAADADAARVLLAANVSSAYVQWAYLEDRLLVAKRALEQRKQLYELVQQRVTAGLDTRLQLKQSESSVPEARQQIEAINEQVAVARHQLEALVAKPGATSGLTPPHLTTLKAMALQQTIPADLLGRRADIAAARWRAEAANSQVANAKTQFYPDVNLAAFAGFQSLGFDNLLKKNSQEWGVGPAIRLPIFEGGRLRANLRGKAADYDAAVQSYNQTVFDAMRDVSDQITVIQSVARQQVEQKQAQDAAEAAYDIGMQRYRAGLGTFLDVLTAEDTVLVQRRNRVDLAGRALQTQVALARALGGGWQPPADITADAASAKPKN